MKRIIILALAAVAFCIKFESPSSQITQQNLELFKYSPDDEYTLPENIDDEKPPSNFVGNDMQAKTLILENKNHGKGKFRYSLETQNGIQLTQIGKLKDAKTFIISGSYSYTGADGRKYRVKYTADELGYHPITELDLEITEILKKDLIQPLKLIDLNAVTKEVGNRIGYSYSNPLQHSTEHFYSYPIPSLDLSAPEIFN